MSLNFDAPRRAATRRKGEPKVHTTADDGGNRHPIHSPGSAQEKGPVATETVETIVDRLLAHRAGDAAGPRRMACSDPDPEAAFETMTWCADREVQGIAEYFAAHPDVSVILRDVGDFEAEEAGRRRSAVVLQWRDGTRRFFKHETNARWVLRRMEAR